MAKTQPILAVFGATGAQGGGVVRAALADPARRFTVRALSRHPEADSAQALVAAGAQVQLADLDDAASLEAALEQVDAVFAVTNFWEHFSPEREIRQAANIAWAVRKTGVGHVMWSTLEDTRRFMPLESDRMPTLQGQYKVPHFDGKGYCDALFMASGVPVTRLHTSFYWDNFIHFGSGPVRLPSGDLALILPIGEAAMPGIAVQDIGACAYALFAQGVPASGQRVGIAGEHLTLRSMAASMSRALGETVHPIAMPPEEFARQDFAGADDLANMYQFKRDFETEFRALRPVEATRALHPGLLTFDDWLRDFAAAIPVPPRP